MRWLKVLLVKMLLVAVFAVILFVVRRAFGIDNAATFGICAVIAIVAAILLGNVVTRDRFA